MKARITAALTLLAWLSSHPQHLAADPVEHLAEAIRIPTISHQDREQVDYGAFEQFHQFLVRTYPTVFEGLSVEVVGQYSLLLTWPGKDSQLKPVLFDSHYDVVPVEPGTEGEWAHPPFSGVIADGYLWGRGALDDKSSVIATLEAIAALLKAGFQPTRTLLFSFGHDEEIGGRDGAANLAARIEELGITLEYMIGEGGQVVEGSPFTPGKTMAMVALAEKTYVTLTLRVRGDGGHSSMPVANNAVVSLARAVAALHDNPFEPELVPPVTSMIEALGEHSDGVQGFLMRNQSLFGGVIASNMANDPLSNAMVRSTTAVTMFNAGIKENVIPQQAEAKVNFRLLPGVTSEQLVAEVKAIIANPNIEVDAGNWGSGLPVTDINGAGYQHLSAAILEVLPDVAVIPGLLVASTDARHYRNLTDNNYRFHTYSLAMADSGAIHGTNERTSVEGIMRSVELSTALIRRVGEN
jgi:carboxypeptidase PM20D1